MLESLSHRIVKRHSDTNIEAATYEGEPEFFARAGSDLNAKAAVDALAGFVDYLRMLDLLHKWAAVTLVSPRPGALFIRMLPQPAIVYFSAITMQASASLQMSLLVGESATVLHG